MFMALHQVLGRRAFLRPHYSRATENSSRHKSSAPFHAPGPQRDGDEHAEETFGDGPAGDCGEMRGGS